MRKEIHQTKLMLPPNTATVQPGFSVAPGPTYHLPSIVTAKGGLLEVDILMSDRNLQI